MLQAYPNVQLKATRPEKLLAQDEPIVQGESLLLHELPDAKGGAQATNVLLLSGEKVPTVLAAKRQGLQLA